MIFPQSLFQQILHGKTKRRYLRMQFLQGL